MEKSLEKIEKTRRSLLDEEMNAFHRIASLKDDFPEDHKELNQSYAQHLVELDGDRKRLSSNVDGIQFTKEYLLRKKNFGEKILALQLREKALSAREAIRIIKKYYMLLDFKKDTDFFNYYSRDNNYYHLLNLPPKFQT